MDDFTELMSISPDAVEITNDKGDWLKVSYAGVVTCSNPDAMDEMSKSFWDAVLMNTPEDFDPVVENQRLRAALTRIETATAFYVATSSVDPEAYARMIYATNIFKGMSLEEAEAAAEKDVRLQFPMRYKADPKKYNGGRG